MAIDILLNTHNDVRKVRDKTLKNYPLKKFHLNSFMTVVSVFYDLNVINLKCFKLYY